MSKDLDLDKPMNLDVVMWPDDKNIHCVYLNDFRICGEKPWGGSNSTKVFKGITLRDLARAIPELKDALEAKAKENYLKEKMSDMSIIASSLIEENQSDDRIMSVVDKIEKIHRDARNL